MHRWQLAVVYLMISHKLYEMVVGDRELIGQDAWDHVQSLAADGWELVSLAPTIGSTTVGWDQAFFTGTKREKTESTGYALWFKRFLGSAA